MCPLETHCSPQTPSRSLSIHLSAQFLINSAQLSTKTRYSSIHQHGQQMMTTFGLPLSIVCSASSSSFVKKIHLVQTTTDPSGDSLHRLLSSPPHSVFYCLSTNLPIIVALESNPIISRSTHKCLCSPANNSLHLFFARPFIGHLLPHPNIDTSQTQVTFTANLSGHCLPCSLSSLSRLSIIHARRRRSISIPLCPLAFYHVQKSRNVPSTSLRLLVKQIFLFPSIVLSAFALFRSLALSCGHCLSVVAHQP